MRTGEVDPLLYDPATHGGIVTFTKDLGAALSTSMPTTVTDQTRFHLFADVFRTLETAFKALRREGKSVSDIVSLVGAGPSAGDPGFFSYLIATYGPYLKRPVNLSLTMPLDMSSCMAAPRRDDGLVTVVGGAEFSDEAPATAVAYPKALFRSLVATAPVSDDQAYNLREYHRKVDKTDTAAQKRLRFLIRHNNVGFAYSHERESFDAMDAKKLSRVQTHRSFVGILPDFMQYRNKQPVTRKQEPLPVQPPLKKGNAVLVREPEPGNDYKGIAARVEPDNPVVTIFCPATCSYAEANRDQAFVVGTTLYAALPGLEPGHKMGPLIICHESDSDALLAHGDRQVVKFDTPGHAVMLFAETAPDGSRRIALHDPNFSGLQYVEDVTRRHHNIAESTSDPDGWCVTWCAFETELFLNHKEAVHAQLVAGATRAAPATHSFELQQGSGAERAAYEQLVAALAAAGLESDTPLTVLKKLLGMRNLHILYKAFVHRQTASGEPPDVIRRKIEMATAILGTAIPGIV